MLRRFCASVAFRGDGMRVITLAQQKGGVAKSTLAIHLSVEAERRGLRSCIVELDKQGTASFWSVQRRASFGKATPEVFRVEAIQLDPLLAQLRRDGVEVALVDLPGANSPSINTAIRASDFVLIPARPQEVDITASGETLGVVHRLHKLYAYVLTFIPATGSRADEARLALEEAGHNVSKTGMGLRNVYQDAVVLGESAQEREPKGKAAAEIAALWDYVHKQLEASDGKAQVA